MTLIRDKCKCIEGKQNNQRSHKATENDGIRVSASKANAECLAKIKYCTGFIRPIIQAAPRAE
eukprot:scaffold84500_cov28-Tisochrysis_lutea.AAC.1